jgi:hypothetical protein
MTENVDWQEPTRARRIRDRERMRARAARVAVLHHGLDRPRDHLGSPTMHWRDVSGQQRLGLCTWEDVLAFRRLKGVKNGDTLKPCSCEGCGNPRRWFGTRTIAELKWKTDSDNQLVQNGLPCHS